MNRDEADLSNPEKFTFKIIACRSCTDNTRLFLESSLSISLLTLLFTQKVGSSYSTDGAKLEFEAVNRKKNFLTGKKFYLEELKVTRTNHTDTATDATDTQSP